MRAQPEKAKKIENPRESRATLRRPHIRHHRRRRRRRHDRTDTTDARTRDITHMEFRVDGALCVCVCLVLLLSTYTHCVVEESSSSSSSIYNRPNVPTKRSVKMMDSW